MFIQQIFSKFSSLLISHDVIFLLYVDQCNGICCQSRDKPFQPTESDILDKAAKEYISKGKLKKRTVQKDWFKSYSWLSFCTTRCKLFCHYCRHAVEQNLLTFSKNAEGAFSEDGFENWKKAIERFKSHETSIAHREAVPKVFAILKAESVSSQLSEQERTQQLAHRKALMLQLSSLRYLLRQGLAIRAHDEIEGNLFQLLKLREEECPELKQWIEEKKYMSPEIINELITTALVMSYTMHKLLCQFLL